MTRSPQQRRRCKDKVMKTENAGKDPAFEAAWLALRERCCATDPASAAKRVVMMSAADLRAALKAYNAALAQVAREEAMETACAGYRDPGFCRSQIGRAHV